MKLAVATMALLAAAPLSATERGFTIRDLVQLDRVADPQLSPDGKWVAFQVRETDMAANKGVNGLWLVDAEGKAAPKRLTAKGANSLGPRWSADGRSLYFTSTRSGSAQVWRVDLGGGEAQQVTKLPLDVGSFRLSPDGHTLALTMEVFPDCGDLDCTKKRLDEKPKTSGVVYDKLFIRHWDAWANGTRSQLFVAAIGADGTAGAPKRVSLGIDGDIPSKPHGDESEYTFAPDGKTIAFSVRIAGKTEPWSTNFDLYTVPADGSAPPRNLTEANKAWDSYPTYSNDGKTLYYLAMKRPTFEADRFGVMALDLASGKTREIDPDWDRSPGGLTLSKDGKTLYANAADNGEHPLFALDIASGKAKKVVGNGQIAGFSLVGNRLAFTRDRLDAPADLFVADANGGGEKRITTFNKERLADVKMGAFEFFDFKGAGDDSVQGFVMKPWNYEAGKKYPVAFLVHGGPQGAFGNDFHYRWNAETYAGQGIAVIAINFHGSTGYGQKFTDSISGDWGGKPLEDLQKGLAAALAKYDFLDGNRACALGGSYGGYMVNWIAGNWNAPFKCLVTHDGIFDNRFMSYTTEELWFDEWEQGGTQWEKPANFERHNPVNFVQNWRVPTLVIHSQQDFRCPLEQGIGVFTALQRRGIESKFLYFPDENHWVLKPENSILWHDTVLGWVKDHTK